MGPPGPLAWAPALGPHHWREPSCATRRACLAKSLPPALRRHGGRETGAVMPLREAWEQALYGPSGFYTRQAPADHFRTSSTASPLFAGAIAELAAACDLDTV